jgi:hypothetical protein
VNAGVGGGDEMAAGIGGALERPTLAELWEETTTGWTEERSEQLFAGIIDKLETRRRRRRFALVAITCASLAVTLMVGLGLAGFDVNGSFAHLWGRVHVGSGPST